VTLVDIRGQPVIAEDTGRNHLVLEADLADSRTPLKCKKLLHGEKADVIFERLMGGLPNLPQNPLDLAKILDSWYRLLNNKALMFAQYHPSWSNEISQLENRIESQFRGVLEFQTNDYFFRLARFPGAPETLPLPATN
jgi:hypothetical protein